MDKESGSVADWGQLGLPPEVVPDAIAAFGDIAQAKKWIEVLDKAPLRTVHGGFEPLWRNPPFLKELASAGIALEDFEHWRAAGLDYAAVPRWATSLRSHGLGAEQYLRWKSAGLDPRDLTAVLAHFDFDSAVAISTNWGADESVTSTSELLEVLRRGVTIEQLKEFEALGLSGHEVFNWNSPLIPVNQWQAWMAMGATPKVAAQYYEAGYTAKAAGPWVRAHVSVDDVEGFKKLGVKPAKAGEYVSRGVWPELLIPTDHGLEEIDLDELIIREDLKGLPSAIRPGEISFTRQSTAAGGDYVPYDFAFNWDGKHDASWYMDISSSAATSPASSSPSTGTLSWPNGRDLEITHNWDELDIHDNAVLTGEAPTALENPRQWIGLADVILDFVFNSGR